MSASGERYGRDALGHGNLSLEEASNCGRNAPRRIIVPILTKENGHSNHRTHPASSGRGVPRAASGSSRHRRGAFCRPQSGRRAGFHRQISGSRCDDDLGVPDRTEPAQPGAAGRAADGPDRRPWARRPQGAGGIARFARGHGGGARRLCRPDLGRPGSRSGGRHRCRDP